MDAWWSVWLPSVGLVLVLLTLLWGASVRLQNASVVDVAWGPGFVVLAWCCVAWGGGGPRSVLLAGLVTLWGLRLGWHLGRRNLGHAEDARYAAWRARTGPTFWWKSLGMVFWFQGLLMGVVSAPLFLVAMASPPAVDDFVLLGTLMFAVGLVFETVGDAQLAAFKKDPANRGKVMDQGLWKYTRHPNYFGDACLWWGLGVCALGVPWGPWGLLGPALMSYLLTRVSGVPMLEKGMASKRPGYAAYVARTSAFFPWFPRSPE